jgi:hypothetical protein
VPSGESQVTNVKLETRRYRILSTILDYIDSDDWKDYGEYLVFGSEAFEQVGISPHERADHATSAEIDEFLQRGANEKAQRFSRERTSPEPPKASDLAAELGQLFPQARDLLREALRQITEENLQPVRSPSSRPTNSHREKLDRHYSRDLLSKLPGIVERVSSLDRSDLAEARP